MSKENTWATGWAKSWVPKWFQRARLEYIPDDWGTFRRYSQAGNVADTAGLPRDHTSARSFIEPGDMPPWKPRDSSNQAVREREALEAFFTPYLALLPVEKGRVLYEYMFLRKTYAELTGFRSRDVAYRAVQRAIQDLARLIAEGYSGYTPPEDKRRRDFAAELRGLEGALNRYWSEEFGKPYVTGEERPFLATPRPPVRHADPNGRTRAVKEKTGGTRNYFQTYVRAEHDRKFGGDAMPKCPTCGRWAWAGHSRIHVYDSGEVRTRT